MTHIKIALASDEKYMPHLATTIASILCNAMDSDELTFYVLDGGISVESKNRFDQLQKLKPFTLNWLPIDFSLLEKCPNISYFSKNTYSRLLLTELLPDEDRLLYMDCDIVVTTSLSELWNADLQGNSFGCVYDKGANSPACTTIKQRLNLEHTYIFNAGILLMDLQKICQNRLFQKTLKWIEENSEIITWADQDGLNVIFQDDKLRLPDKWNVSAVRTVSSELKELPAIIHYMGTQKPWQLAYRDLFGWYYWKYRDLTPWPSHLRNSSFAGALIYGIKNRLCIARNLMADSLGRFLIRYSPFLQHAFDMINQQREIIQLLQEKLRKKH